MQSCLAYERIPPLFLLNIRQDQECSDSTSSCCPTLSQTRVLYLLVPRLLLQYQLSDTARHLLQELSFFCSALWNTAVFPLRFWKTRGSPKTERLDSSVNSRFSVTHQRHLGQFNFITFCAKHRCSAQSTNETTKYWTHPSTVQLGRLGPLLALRDQQQATSNWSRVWFIQRIWTQCYSLEL